MVDATVSCRNGRVGKNYKESKPSIHAYVGAGSSSRANLVVHRMLQFHSTTFVHLLRFGKVVTSIGLSKLTLIVLDGGIIRRTKVLSSHEPHGKWGSFPVDLRWKANEISRVLLQAGNIQKIVIGPKTLASFDDFEIVKKRQEDGRRSTT